MNLVGQSVDRVHPHLKGTEWIRDAFDRYIEFPNIADDTGSANDSGTLHPGQGRARY